MKKVFHIIFALVIIVSACEKDDYRDKYCGNYEFTTLYKGRTMINRDSIYFETVYDTSTFAGTVKKSGTQKLQIIFQGHETEPDLEDDGTTSYPTLGKIYPTVDEGGVLTYKEFTDHNYGHVAFSGQFFSNDSLEFYYGYEDM
ncbi:MAG: hypothetical protein IH594_12260, partial [Bacteroidales bacterium]|nr:hypothetical protein [Bacteroidales bacterium]